MKNIKRGLLTLSFTFVMVMAMGVVNVNAADYSLEDELDNLKSGTPLTLTSQDTLTYNGEQWIGKEGRLTVTYGDLSIKYDDAGTPGSDATNIQDDTVLFTVDGSVILNTGKQFIVQVKLQVKLEEELKDIKLPVNFTINEGSYLGVYGTLAMPSGTNSVLVNNGSINITQPGAIELRDRANIYQGNGNMMVYGKLAIYGNSGSNIGEQVINLYENGFVYSEADVTDNINVGNVNMDGYKYTMSNSENNVYESVTATIGSREFPYAYTVTSEKITDVVPVTPDEDTTTEETTTENVKNPETSDGILLFLGLTVVGFAGVALTYRRLHN